MHGATDRNDLLESRALEHHPVVGIVDTRVDEDAAREAEGFEHRLRRGKGRGR
jgi:hypothetical protein